MHEQPQPRWYADPLILCWPAAMLLVMLTPTALMFDVALWRVALAMLCELGAPAIPYGTTQQAHYQTLGCELPKCFSLG